MRSPNGHPHDLSAVSRARARLLQGIRDDEFVVHYQPFVDLGTQRVIGVEALARWEHPERGLLGPHEFLDLAERSGAIVRLGELVLARACDQAAAWRRSGADIRLSVNVSARQFADPRLVERVTGILQRTGLDPTRLWLEITETAAVAEIETASQALDALAAMGVGVSIDDFGTGWASLTYLKRFPVGAMKIDRSFVSGLASDPTSAAITRSVLSLGAELDLFVVAEGVERQEQHDLLRTMGCSLGQGFLYGRPTSADEVPIHRAGRLPSAPAPATATALGAPAPAVAAPATSPPGGPERDDATRDGLTGLGNRRRLDRVLPRARSGAVVVLDLDHAETAGDEHDPALGDDVLRSFGRVLDTGVRAQDAACRVAGDEFALVLPDLDLADAVRVVDRVRESWRSAGPRRGTLSAGVAAVTDEGGPAALAAAERAMRRAKASGRDRTVRASAPRPASQRACG